MQFQIVSRLTVGVCEFVNQNKNNALVINDYLCLIVIFSRDCKRILSLISSLKRTLFSRNFEFGLAECWCVHRSSKLAKHIVNDSAIVWKRITPFTSFTYGETKAFWLSDVQPSSLFDWRLIWTFYQVKSTKFYIPNVFWSVLHHFTDWPLNFKETQTNDMSFVEIFLKYF